MKKIIAALIVCLGAYQANAQITVKPGVRAGLNLSTFTNSDFDRKADFYVGGLVSIKLASFYTLQPELTYSRQGAKGKIYFESVNFDPIDPVFYDSYDYDYEISYLSLGIMNKFRIVDGFHAIVGPTLDFRLDDNFNTYESPQDIDLTLNGGIGYTLPMGLTIEARYKMGLLDIFGNYDDDDYYDDEDNGNYDDVILNSVFQLGVSYTF